MTQLVSPLATSPDLPARAVPPLDDGYRVVFERNPTPMWVFDLDTHRFLAVNAAAVAEYGYPPEKFLTLTIRDMYGEADLERFDGLARDAAQELHTGDWIHRRQDGTLLRVEIRSNDLSFQGRRARLIHVTNVTARFEAEGARLLAETARRESEQMLGAIVESSDDAIISKTPDGIILTWNAAAARMYGYTPEEAIGASIYVIVPPECHRELAASLLSVANGERIAPYETRRIHKDGHELFVSVSIAPIMNRAGRVVGISATARDITQRKTMEDQLRQAQKMEAIGRLAGGVAHDFNNMLTAILGYSELLTEQIGPDKPIGQDLREITAAAERAAALTKQLLAFSRKQVFSLVAVDITQVVRTVKPMLQRLLGERITIATALADDLAPVMADVAQLEHLLVNLSVNARDAMPAGGLLTFTTANVTLDATFRRDHPGAVIGSYAMMSVADTGIGIASDVLGKIFEPFFTTKDAGRGTGLGLAAVYGTVKQLGGYIQVESHLGRGTTFSLYLPKASRPAQTPSPPMSVSTHVGTETILVVEDESGVRAFVKIALQRFGYRVIEAESAEVALTLLKGYAAPVHLLLTDIVLPGMDGTQLATHVTRERPEVRVLFMSGYARTLGSIEGGRDSSLHLLEKPFTAAALLTKTRQLLGVPLP
jgi:PAS domain S-box-containing protein